MTGNVGLIESNQQITGEVLATVGVAGNLKINAIFCRFKDAFWLMCQKDFGDIILTIKERFLYRAFMGWDNRTRPIIRYSGKGK